MVGKRWLKWAIVKRTINLLTNNEFDFYRNTFAFPHGTIQIPRTEQIFTCGIVTNTQHVLRWIQFVSGCPWSIHLTKSDLISIKSLHHSYINLCDLLSRTSEITCFNFEFLILRIFDNLVNHKTVFTFPICRVNIFTSTLLPIINVIFYNFWFFYQQNLKGSECRNCPSKRYVTLYILEFLVLCGGGTTIWHLTCYDFTNIFSCCTVPLTEIVDQQHPTRLVIFAVKRHCTDFARFVFYDATIAFARSNYLIFDTYNWCPPLGFRSALLNINKASLVTAL